MNTENLSKEQRILRVMRKVLASVVKDTTPQPGMRHALSDQTIEDIKQCFALISAREGELAEAAGLEQARPGFTDEPKRAQVIPISKPGLGKKTSDEG
jgi:hypothetical protein